MVKLQDGPPAFAYQVIWEEIGDGPIAFDALESRRGEFKTLAEVSVGLGLDVPKVDREKLSSLIASLDLATAKKCTLVERLELVVGWCLVPLQRRALELDVRSARASLGQVAKDAARLSVALSKIDPRTAALLHCLLPLEPDARLPGEALDFYHLANKVHDLALVAKHATNGFPISSGRPHDYVRNTALVLAMQAIAEATGEDVTISRGTGDRPEPHFTNPGGEVIRALFAGLGFAQEPILAQAAERLRRDGRL